MDKRKESNLVYSTAHGRLCPACEKPVQKCSCKRKQQGTEAKKDGIIRLARETKGRKGKGVTLVQGLPLNDDELKELAKKLKQKCGTGGTTKNGIIEIQGEQRETLAQQLREMGYTVKIAGG